MVTVSVVIPTYQHVDVLDRAIDSALAQTLSDIEVIVVDDASTDGTIDLLESYDDQRLRYHVHEENLGGSAARNTGIEDAAGEYVAFLDSDDEWAQTKLELQVSCLEDRSAEWGGVYCGFRQRRGSTVSTFFDRLFQRNTGKEGSRELLRDILMLQFAHGGASTLVIRQSALDELGGFDATFDRHQDWEFLVRFLKRYKLAYVDDVLVEKHDTGLPDLETMIDAREQYLGKFGQEVIQLSLDGYPLVPRHRFFLAKVAFANGERRAGFSYLRNSSAPGLRDYFGLGWATLMGLK